MANSSLTAEQKIAARILDEFVLDPEILLKRCSLDYGHHKLEPRTDLGDLEKLPTELRHHMLGFLEVKSLLTFRRVNHSAMSTVDGMVEYHKVMDKASNCIRMAMAIKTEDTFTFKQLLAKLCQKMCDGANCNQLAPYIDVFKLSRRCLSIGNGCPIPLGPLREDCVQDLVMSVSEGTSTCYYSLRHFQPYEESVYSKFWLEVDAPGGPRELFWDFADVKAAFLEPNNPGNVAEFAFYEAASARDDPRWKLCSVQAPWLSMLGTQAEQGVFCEGQHNVPESIDRAREVLEMNPADEGCVEYDYAFPNPMEIPYLTVQQLEHHMKTVHVEKKEES